MGNTYGAHIFKRASVGEREEVTIKLFMPDGTPLELGAPPDDGEEIPPVELPEGLMVFTGVWNATQDYSQYDVVRYGDATYIFDEDHVAGEIPTLLFNGHPIDKFWDPVAQPWDPAANAGAGGPSSPFELVLGSTSHTVSTEIIRASPAPYDAFAFKVAENPGGTGHIVIRSRDKFGASRDLYGTLYRRKADDTGWDYIMADDDGSGAGHPLINATGASASPGLYVFGLSSYAAYIPPNASYDGVSLGFLETPSLQGLVLGSFFDFPIAKTTQIG